MSSGFAERAKGLKSAATCTAPAVYYKSCLCGEHGDATFTYGEALGHNYVKGTCTRCGATKTEAVAFAHRLVEEGADIIDVGGESTRPGAADVSPEEELDRVVGVVEALAREGITVSVDTSKAVVMQEAVKAGAEILNDIRAFREPGADVAAATHCDAHAGNAPYHAGGAALRRRRSGSRGFPFKAGSASFESWGGSGKSLL